LCSGTLEDFLNGKYDGPLFNGINEIEILYQITQGLQYLHALKIVHRDIKPRNILIGHGHDDEDAKYIRPQMKLADFGLCKILNQQIIKEDLEKNSSPGPKDWSEPDSFECSSLQMMKLANGDKGCFTNTSRTDPRGTRGWIAPELFEEERVDYFKVDIWALGCIFAYTLTWGKHPFGDEDERNDRIRKKEPMGLVQEDLNVNPFIPSSTRFEAYQLIESMLDVDPEIRPSVDEVLENPFFSFAVMSVSYADLLYHDKKILRNLRVIYCIQKDPIDQLLDVCHSFRTSRTEDQITKFENLMKVVLTVSVTNYQAYSYKLTSALRLLCSYYTNGNLIGYVQQLLNQNGINMNRSDATGKATLHLLCENYQHENLIDLVQLLIKNGADVNARCRFRQTPLFYLCWNYKKDNLMEIVQLFVKNGADINADNGYKTSPRIKLHIEGFHT